MFKSSLSLVGHVFKPWEAQGLIPREFVYATIPENILTLLFIAYDYI